MVYWFHPVHLSVCPSVDKIGSAPYIPEYSPDPFHIYTSYQVTSEGVLRVHLFLAATKQLYDWFSPSVCLSVCLSVRPSVHHTFFTMLPSSYHHEIFRSYYQWQKWRPCKRSRSKVKVTEVNTQLNRFRTVTLVWIHVWWWNDAYSLVMRRRGALLFFKVIRQISRSHGSKKHQIWPRLGVSGL